MIDITSIIPVIVIACASMAFKETRIFALFSIAALSYFYPLIFLTTTVIGLGFGIYYFKYIRQGGRRR